VSNEYMRRNLVHAASVGAIAELDDLIGRAESVGYLPQWLLDGLGQVERRICMAPKELAAWRDAAPDKPNFVLIDGPVYDIIDVYPTIYPIVIDGVTNSESADWMHNQPGKTE